MRVILAFIAVLVIVAADAAPSSAGAFDNRRDKSKRPRPGVSTDHIIKDLTIPWPFRQHWIFDDFKAVTVADTDGDGVADDADRCPNTPRDVAVDDHGCPVEMTETETEFLDTGVIRTSEVRFESGRAELKPESRPVLDEIGRILVQWPELQIEIGGHTDSQREESFNQELSERRAGAVRDYLLKKFRNIDADNLTVKGYGESRPVASNDTDTGRAQNRRVEFTVLDKDTLNKQIERRGLRMRR